VNVEGIPRSYFYQRFSQDLRLVLQRGQSAERRFYQETEEPEMVNRVNIQESMSRLTTCPVCGKGLREYDRVTLDRWCASGCGDFTITEVISDGDVMFEFKMAAPQKLENSDADNSADGVGRGPGGDETVPDLGVVPG
jgi:hypothetical protein